MMLIIPNLCQDMVINNPEWLELTKEVESFMSVNGLIMSNQTSAPPTVYTQGGIDVVGDWTQYVTTNNAETKPYKARAVLIPRPNSHPFSSRTLHFDQSQEIKVGRSLARNRVSDTNAIFDCKVLSRNHAVIWYSDEKFYIKDTGSSNGTFINNQRISPGGVKSEAVEVCSDDIVQFGVDVTETSRKETHGCIVTTLKLYLPDGTEAKGNSHSIVGGCPRCIPSEDLCRLNLYIQEAVQREQMLERKLLNLQKIIELTRKNSSNNWKAMIDEDRLLSRIDLLENKLQCFQKNCTEDKLREEILKLQEDKSDYQNSAKEALRKVYQERSEALQKLSTMERALCSSEDECSLLRDQLCHTQQNLQETTARLGHSETQYAALNDKVIQEKSQTYESMYTQLNSKHEYDELKAKMGLLFKEKEELLVRVTLFEYCENLTNVQGQLKEDAFNMLNRLTTLLHDKSSKTEDDDDESFFVNQPEFEPLFLKDSCLVESQLNCLGKKLRSLQNKVYKEASDDTSENNVVISDGNQNVDSVSNTDNVDTIEIIKDILMLSWLIFVELKAKQNAAKQNDNVLPEIEEQYKLKTTESEKQLSSKSTDSENESETETIVGSNDTQILNGSDTTASKLFSIQNEIKELKTELIKINLIKDNLEIELTEARKIIDKNDVCLQTDNELLPPNEIIIEKKLVSNVNTSTNGNLLNFDISLGDDDLVILSDPKVQNEEELIIFKEKYNDITNENLKLKEEILTIRNSYEQLKNKSVMSLLFYLSPVIVLIAYLLISYL